MKFQMGAIIVYPLLCLLHYIHHNLSSIVCTTLHTTIYPVLCVLHYVSHNLSSVVYYIMYLNSGTD